MPTPQCPLCFSPLDSREVTPCMECGHRPEELPHFRDGKHTFAEYRIFGDLTLVLCLGCYHDFASFHPNYFGLPDQPRISSGRFQLVRDLYPLPAHSYDEVCPDCDYRLAWLEFVAAARQLHETGHA